ncbi:MAG: hypothetical protein V4844_03560 [Pseudomonadota bacterium]
MTLAIWGRISTLFSALMVPVASSITSTFFATARTLLTLTGAPPAPAIGADAGAAPDAEAAAGAADSRPQPARATTTASAAALLVKLLFMQIPVERGSLRRAPIRYSL